jgi:hypothetical protein
MDFTPFPRLVEIQTRARAFVDSVLEPLEVVCDSGHGLPPDVEARARAAARESGLFAPNVPAEWGGAGLDVLEQVALEEELGRATNCLWAIMWRPANVLVHCTDAQRARYLLPYIRGEFRGCYAVTEPGAGSDTSRLATEARPDGDGSSSPARSGSPPAATSRGSSWSWPTWSTGRGAARRSSWWTATRPASPSAGPRASPTVSSTATPRSASRTSAWGRTPSSAGSASAWSSPRTGSATSGS